MLGAVFAGARFVRRHPVRVFGLYLLDGLAFLALVAVYAFIAPGAGSTGVSLWWGFLVAQAWVLARIWVKLLFLASETALFQSLLAHAGYTAAPPPTWPDSPSADAIAPGPD